MFAISSCNTSPKDQDNSVEKSLNSQSTDVDTSAASANWDNPRYADSMKEEAKKASDRMSEKISDVQKNYTPEDWEREYCLKIDSYVTLVDIDIKHNANYEPYVNLIIKNNSGLRLQSVKIIFDGRSEKSATDENIFLYKKEILAKGEAKVSFKVKDNTTVKDFYFYSCISGNRKLCESRIALTDYVKKAYPK
jgi:hypothetical protein